MHRPFLALPLLLLASAPLAAAESMAPEVVIATSPGCFVGDLRAAYNSRRNEFLVVWHEGCPIGSPSLRVLARRLDGFGLPMGDTFPVASSADGRDRYGPAVAYDDWGDRYLVVYTYDYHGDGSDLDIRARFLPAAGVDPTWFEFAVAQTGAPEYSADVAYSWVDFRFVVVWTRIAAATEMLEGTRLTFPMALTPLEFGTAGPRSWPDIAFDPLSNTVAVVTDNDQDIFLRQVLVANGQALIEKSVSAEPLTERFAAVASCGGDQFLVSWDSLYGGDDWDVLARFFHGGVTDGPAFAITATTAREWFSEIACLAGGRSYLVVFEQEWPGARGVSARRMSVDKTMRDAFPVRGPIGGEPLSVTDEATAGGRHGWLVAWATILETGLREIHGRVVWELFAEGFEWGSTANWSGRAP